MGNLSESLKKHAKRLGISRQVEAVGVVEDVTAEVARYIQPADFEIISFKDSVLKIYTTSAAAASEISMRLPAFLENNFSGTKITLRFTTKKEAKDLF